MKIMVNFSRLLNILIALVLNLLKDNPRALIIVVFFISFSLYPLAYDNAAYAAQNGKWKDAHEKLNSILVDAPDRADVLYDAGVAAHNLGNFAQAGACFLRAAECTDDNNLRARAHFNAGNALVEHKDLPGALDQYEKVLRLAPTHEYACHNRDRVKQMLEEQKQKQQQQGDDQKDDQKDEDEQKDKEDKQQDKQNQSKNDKNSQQGNDQQKGESNNDSSDDGSDQESEGEQGDGAEGGSKDTQRKDHGNKKENQKQSTDKQKRNGDQQLENKSDDKNNKKDTQQGDKHKESPEKQLNGSDKASVPSEEGQKQASSSAKATADREGGDEQKSGVTQDDLQRAFEQKLNDPWLLSVLNNQEERDKTMNKQLMEAKINQHGGKDGQNCW